MSEAHCMPVGVGFEGGAGAGVCAGVPAGVAHRRARSSWESTDTVSAGCLRSFARKRSVRFWLQDRLQGLLPRDSRECSCHRVPVKSGASVVLADNGRARYRGVARCGNVWVCPLCAPVIAVERSKQVGSVLRWGSAEGFSFLKLTFTCRHARGDGLLDLMDKQVKALRSFKASRPVRRIRESVGYLDSVTAKEATWGPSSGWHPHQHEYWMCNLGDVDLGDVDLGAIAKELELEWLKALRRQGLDGAAGVALHLGKMKADEVNTGAATGYLTKSGTAAGYLTKSGTAAALELVGGVGKQGKKGHKQGHYTQMELLSLGEDWADKLFLEFYLAFKNRKQLTFGRLILKAYRDLFGTVPGDDFEVVKQNDKEKPGEVRVINLEPRQLWVLRKTNQAVQVLELVESGLVSEAVMLVERVWESWNRDRYLEAVSYVSHLWG